MELVINTHKFKIIKGDFESLLIWLIFRDYGATRGFANESEFTVVKVDFYNDIKKYLAELDNTDIRSLEDIVKYVNVC